METTGDKALSDKDYNHKKTNDIPDLYKHSTDRRKNPDPR